MTTENENKQNLKQPTFWPVVYRIQDVPEDTIEIDNMDLIVTWEVSMAGQDRNSIHYNGIEEINELFRIKIINILKDRGGLCVRIQNEKIEHRLNYAHESSVMTGTYRFIVYAKK